MKSIIETIRNRESVRTYDGKGLSRDEVDKIENFIRQIKVPFGADARMELIRAGVTDGEKVKLGTYGYISGATDYIALIYKEEAPFAAEWASYMFEEAVLFCTALGLGTCWLGGSFNRKDFKGRVELKSGEVLRIVSPVGHRGEKKRLFESVMGFNKKKPRKPFGDIFFDGNFSKPLTEKEAGIYSQPLEMVRLGPSANNKQSWRVVKEGDILHFYETASFGFSSIDMGIALCHFELTCKELDIKGNFEFCNMPDVNSAKYAVSWRSATEM